MGTRGSKEAAGSSSDTLFADLTSEIDKALAREPNSRFTYLIGNNGTGKSRVLARIADHYEDSGYGPTVGCISNAVYDRFTLRTAGNVHYLGARTSGNAVFHSAIDRLLCRMIVRAMGNRSGTLKTFSEVLGMEFMFEIGGSEVAVRQKELQKLVDKRKLKGRTVNNFLSQEERRLLIDLVGARRSFKGLDRASLTALGQFLDLNPEVSVFVKADGDQWLNFNQLSTGEQNRALIFAKVLSIAADRCIFLIDEPEISLHLHWQMDFHRSLSKLLERLHSYHVVIATHSPTLISEAAKSSNGEAGRVVILEPNVHGAIAHRAHSFSSIASHEELVLKDFNTATYRTHAVDLEIADAVLSVGDRMSPEDEVVKRLEELSGKLGLTEKDKGHISAAIRLVKSHALSVEQKT